MIITCPKCHKRYKVSTYKIPPGKRAVGDCRNCRERLIVTREGLLGDDQALSTLPVPISYTHSKIVKVPEEILKRNRLEAYFDDSPVAEHYKFLKTQILQATREKGLNTLLVTSAGAGEGKSTTAANLAVVMAQAGKQVILADADLRRPSLHRFFGVSNKSGLSSALMDDSLNLDNFLVNTEVNNLRILPSGPLPPNAADMLNSAQMERRIDQLSKEADVVIFDSPPVLAVSDPSILARRIEVMLLVIQAGRTRSDVCQRARAILEQVGVTPLGVVLNKFNPKHESGYGYSYYYYYANNGSNGRVRKR